MITPEEAHETACSNPTVSDLLLLLKAANDAFDDCAGPYAQELVQDEQWRQFA